VANSNTEVALAVELNTLLKQLFQHHVSQSERPTLCSKQFHKELGERIAAARDDKVWDKQLLKESNGWRGPLKLAIIKHPKGGYFYALYTGVVRDPAAKPKVVEVGDRRWAKAERAREQGNHRLQFHQITIQQLGPTI